MDITKRKQEVLKLLTKGKRTSEIAEELKLAEATIRLHISDLKLLFNAKTTPQLIYKAGKNGVI